MTTKLKAATDAVSHRVDTIAATEAATAFEDERQRQETTLLRESRDTRWIVVAFKLWDSTLDRRLCSTCSASTGELRPFGVSFSLGSPGHAHPRCRCRSATIFLPPVEIERAE